MISFHVAGTPASQGSKKVFNGRLIDADPKLKKWRQAVALVAATQTREQWDCPVSVTCAFTFERPKARKWDVWKQSSPDLDKLCRAVLDALTMSGVIRDDARVAELRATKLYDQTEGVWVTVAPLTLNDRRDLTPDASQGSHHP